jgi:hypothetical protein
MSATIIQLEVRSEFRGFPYSLKRLSSEGLLTRTRTLGASAKVTTRLGLWQP